MKNLQKIAEFNFLPAEFDPAKAEIAVKQYDCITKSAYANSGEMSKEEWRDERRKGIGGSDVAAILGESPFKNNLQLWLDKTGIAKDNNELNSFRLDYGNSLEPLVAKEFAKKYKALCLNDKGMYRHTEKPYVLANLDRFIILPTGELVILECKTTNSFSKRDWENDAPIYYKWQGRQYLAVINSILEANALPAIENLYYCCVYGNTEDEIIIQKMTRQLIAERAMLDEEERFWNYVTELDFPEYNGDSKTLLDISVSERVSLATFKGIYDEDKTEIELYTDEASALVKELLDIEAAEKEVKKSLAQIVEKKEETQSKIVDLMAGQDVGKFMLGEDNYTVTLPRKQSRSTDYKLLSDLYPEAYQNCVKDGLTKPSFKLTKEKKKKTK